jgi:hypothetical protein
MIKGALDVFPYEMRYRQDRRDIGVGDRVGDLLDHVYGRPSYRALIHDQEAEAAATSDA